MKFIKLNHFRPQFLVVIMLGWPLLLVVPGLALRSMQRPIQDPLALAYYGGLFGCVCLVFLLSTISVRLRRFIINPDIQLSDAAPSLLVLSVIFGAFSLSNIYELLRMLSS